MLEDPILFWNEVVQECNRLDHTGPMQARNQRGPTLSSRATAIVHLAMHDAFVLARRGEGSPPAADDPYLPPAARPPYTAVPGTVLDVAVSAAVSAAASVALLDLYPSQKPLIDGMFARISASNGAISEAHAFGAAVAAKILELRMNDGAYVEAAHMDSPAYGRHREDPLNNSQGFLGVAYGATKPFAMTAFPNQAPPPGFTAPLYLAHHREVRAKGATPSAKVCTRSEEETIIGLYWAYDGAKDLGTPPRLYNQVLRTIARAKGLTTEQNARLFMLANVAMGDAGIAAWYWKYRYDLWRPVVGLREYDRRNGPAAPMGLPPGPIDADCDPFWRPLGAPKTNVTDERVRSFTPPFPAYPSGHATFGAAAFQTARVYLASIGKATINADGTDDIAFSFVSDELNGRSIDPDDTVRTRHVRSFAGLHEAIYENSVSRVFLGVHWRFDGTTGTSPTTMLAATDEIGGVPLGLAIATSIVGKPGMLNGNVKPSPASVKPPA